MYAVTRITFWDEENGKFFGEGPARLLRGVEETGSLRAAATAMGMAYSKAFAILRNAEKALGFALTHRAVGGREGGGSRLTPQGRAWLLQYERYRDACVRTNAALLTDFTAHSGELGCVIMASGLGKRFGGNKLLADFGGAPLISRVLAATDGLFARRVAVTRHRDVAALCEAAGVQVVLHDLPHRSDTVRLGLEAVGDVDGCLFCPADQPLLRRKTVQALAESAAADPSAIWRPACGGVQGAPVLFPRWTYRELRTLPVGKGGAFVAQAYPAAVRTVEVHDAYELYDADTPEALETLQDYL